jgi:hypothetical protein
VSTAARAAIAAATALLVALLAVSSSAGSGSGSLERAARPIHITGIAYSFDNQERIGGALIRVAELPGVRTRTQPNGSYDLRVPNRTRVTPYIRAEGYHGIYLQTFFTRGRNLRRVNFQIPTVDTYHALAALLGVRLDENDNPARCVVVSTISTKNVRNLSFAEFIAYGAHGVAGATARARPALPRPIYFNESVIPDRSLTESTVDGGVIWLNVPRGVYRFSAHHPSERFASFLATCKPGRLVNANPPQGLYQLRAGERG